jgi:hypothetical protein
MRSVADTHTTGLAREYIRNLLKNHPQHTVAVNAWIDQFETHAPTIAYELFMAGGDATRAVERALKLVDTGNLHIEYLGGFISGSAGRPLSTEEFYEILKRLTDSVKDGKNVPAMHTATELVAFRLQNDQRDNQMGVLEDAVVQSLIWELLEATAPLSFRDSYHWSEILNGMAKIDLDKAARVASFALIGEGYQQKEDAEKILVELAKSHPKLVMQRVGELILSEEYGWHFSIEKYRFIIQYLPLDAMKDWLHSTGVVGAQRIARNLPIPYLDECGKPVVPPLTEFVLSEFEDDECTFREFCIGSRNRLNFVSDIESQKQKEAEVAREFLNHPQRRVREWAEYEISRCEQDAKMWRQIDEESRI